MAVDPNGVSYVYEYEMCYAWGVPYATYAKRKSRGKSLEECLQPARVISDEMGNEFKSVRAMCKHYDVPLTMYYARLSRGWSRKDALTREALVHHDPVDHNGVRFDTVQSMCEHYGTAVPTYYSRLNRGFSVEESLLSKKLYDEDRSVKDLDGVVYETEADMCRAHGVSYTTYMSRKKRGMSLEQRLSKGRLTR